MGSFIKTTLRVVVLSSALLSGCFSSEKPLLTEDDAVTPLPDAFALFEMDKGGNLKTSEKGEAIATNFARVGKVYVERGENTTSTLTLMKLDNNANLFLAQYVISVKDKQGNEVPTIYYMIVKRLDNIIYSYAPPLPGETGLDAALKDAGIAFTINRMKFFAFSDKTQLLAAARVYASRLEEGISFRYRIASSKQEIAALQQEIAASRAKDAPPTAASPVVRADGQAQQECDALAASTNDRPAGVPGVQFEKIDAPRAEAACRRAVQERPSPRLYAQLGRALDAGRKYADAVANYRVAADQGSPLGQHSLGRKYDNGEGVARGVAQAVFWYRKAADQGFAPAQYNLGLLYYQGDRVKEDDAQAVYWFRKAAAQGYAPAQNGLGAAYNAGKGVEYDDDKAIYWFRKAAAQGDPEARENLATLEQFYRTNGGSNGVDAERQRRDSERRLRCGSYQMSGNRVGMSTIPGCY